MIHKLTPSVDYNWWLNAQFNESTNQNATKKVLKVKKTSKKTFYKTLGANEINSLMSPPSLII